MIKGYYKTNTAIPCYKEDKHFFKKMMRDQPDHHHKFVFVRQVKPGDVIISETEIMRWRIICEDGKLYLGFYETPPEEKPYDGLERKKILAFYVVEEDTREYTQQKYMLCRIPRWMAYQVFNLKM